MQPAGTSNIMQTKRDFLSITDLSPQEVLQIIRRARQMKAESIGLPLVKKNIALLFEKPSLRTSVSFQVGIQQLGGHSVYLGQQEVDLGVREPVADIARVLSGYVDCIVARVFSHDHLVQLSQFASVPVINALSDWEHPCQVMADLLTINEYKGELNGLKVAFIGDGGNVARSLCLGLPAVGMSFAIATPEEYKLDNVSLAAARRRSGGRAKRVISLLDPKQAVSEADVVYTDAWISMGQEQDAVNRRRRFQGYSVDSGLLARAKPDALFMHDMPVHYGEEVPSGMLDHAQSVVFAQAHNRLHVQKAILEFILSRK
jgi:ornithine carbamoyltransferase